jgi:apolipoprotein N-acyltransferase
MAPVLWLTLPVLVWLIDGIGTGASGRGRAASLLSRIGAAALIGWAFGFGYFLAGLYWVGFAFLVEADLFGWLLPFAVALLPAGLALFTAASCALAVLFWSSGAGRIFALAAAVTAGEWLRGHVLGGFPWNLMGYALAFTDPLAQSAAIFGVYGLSFLTVLVFASPAVLGTAEGKAAARAWLVPLLAVAILPALALYGLWRLPGAAQPEVAGVRLRIVQPNIPQRQKWLPENRGKILAEYLSMTDEATSPASSGVSDPTHVIWPESALPFVLSENAEALAAIAALLPDHVTLITGAVRRAPPAAGDADAKNRAFNSVHVINGRGEIVATYDKANLVPFGEFLPLQGLLERIGLEQLTRMRGGFTAGPAARTLHLEGAPAVAPLVCYEIIFPGSAIDRSDRPGWMLNVTNDAWFGDSSGPRQHLHQARLRAVEEGLPLVRAANTGISGVIDPYGRIVARLPLNRRGVIDGGLPEALPPTVFARYGDRILAALTAIGFLAALAGMLRDRRAAPRAARRPA